MEDNSFSFEHSEKREHSITVLPALNPESIREEIELEKFDYETLLEEIRIG